MKKKFILEGRLLPFGVKSQHGRVYTKESIEKAFNEFKERVDKGEMFGVLEQRAYDWSGPYMEIPASEYSHKVISVELKDDGIYGKLEILGTPKGKLVKEISHAQLFLYGAQRATGCDRPNSDIIDVDEILSYDLTGSSAFGFEQEPLKMVS